MQIIIVSTSDVVRIQWDHIYKAYSIVPATWEQLKGVTYHHHYFSGKESADSVGDPDFIPGSARSPGKGNGNPLQYSCLENPMGRGAWQAVVPRVAKSWTEMKWLNSHACIAFLTSALAGGLPLAPPWKPIQWNAAATWMNFETQFWEFPGGLVFGTLCFHCRGCGFTPWLGN